MLSTMKTKRTSTLNDSAFSLKKLTHAFLVRLCLVVFLLITYKTFAQQEPAYSMFMYTGNGLNPAMAGSSGTFGATALYRKQWAGIDGGPQTQTLLLDAPVANDRVGLGLVLMNDQIGIHQNLNVTTQYAYRLKFDQQRGLAMGLQAGLNNYKADYTSVATNPNQQTDNSFSDYTNQLAFNFGTGVYYYAPKFFAGVSVPTLINESVDGSDNNELGNRQTRHYYVMAGYVINASHLVTIKPSTFVKVAEGAPIQVDVNTNFWYQEKYGLGFSYRTNDSFSTILQLNVANQLTVGYAHDFVVSKLSRYTQGNNEVMLRYRLPHKANDSL